jgi:hypothetical protein
MVTFGPPRWRSGLRDLFLYEGRIDRTLLALFLMINALVLVNNILHDPVIGYDGTDHLKYIRVLPYRLPTLEDTREFFSAPLPYYLPSLFDKACLVWIGDETSPGTNYGCLVPAGKFAQFINFLFSIGVTLFAIRIAEELRPGNRNLKVSSLVLLGLLTVYYKTFVQVRGEPYLVFFTLWEIYLVGRLIRVRGQVTWRDGMLPGVILGLALLSRQWGLMLVPALVGLSLLVWAFDPHNGWRVTKALAVVGVTSFLICGWFYLYLFAQNGTFFPFNRSRLAFSFSNQPATFYRNTGLKDFLLFKSPTRSTFDNQFFPVLYSDIWGDYWGHFVFIQDRSSLGEQGYGNHDQVTPYLGRVNALSLFPSLIFLAGIVSSVFSLRYLFHGSAEERGRSLFIAFLSVYIFVSSLLYLYFLVIFPVPDQGDTIKATYILHVLIVLPFLGAEFLERLRVRSSTLYALNMGILGLVWVHNLPAMITRYRMFFL